VPSTQILRHVRNYSSAGTLSAAAGVVTFPILTRNLTVDEYGILGLMMGTLTLFVAIGKLGLQHAVIRFYAQITHNVQSEFSTRQLNSTVLIVFALMAVTTTTVWLLAGSMVLPGTLQNDTLPSLFWVASGTVFLRLLGSAFLNFLRASERSGKVATLQITSRYLYIGFVLAVLLLSDLSPFSVLACTLVAEIITFCVSLYFYRDKITFSFGEFRARLASSMFIYGAPLMVLETLGVFLRLSDRYLIQGMLGEADLGMYSASYNLTSYLEVIVLATVAQALRPIYMKLWERDGVEPTRDFLSNSFRMYLALGIPVVAIFSATAPHLLNFLASPKFSAGTVIIPFVTISFMMDGAVQWLGAGLYIKRNTRTLMFWSMTAAVLNLLLNILVIPHYGILGASVVTVLSFSVFLVGVSVSAAKYLRLNIDWVTPTLVAVMSFAVYQLLMQLDFGFELTNLFAKGLLGCGFCLLGLMIIDAKLSEQITGLVRNRLRRAT
jgi:O-antigen/teichoic acid export membrane protein